MVIVLHGYISPDVYTTLAYTTRYADALARAGYIAIHPNLRNFPPSDEGPVPFRVGIAADVLNLIALAREHGGKPGPLEQADPQRIGVGGTAWVEARPSVSSPWIPGSRRPCYTAR